MNKRIKSNLVLFLSSMVVSSILGGCSASKPASTASTASSSDNPNKDAVTLTVEVFDRGKPGQASLDDNYWTKYVNDNFGKKFNTTVKFVPIARSQEVDKLNLLMAANQAPDICFSYVTDAINLPSNYAKQGGITELDDLLAKYGTNLTKYLGKDLLKYGSIQGKQMAIPAKRTILATNCAYIRKDWLDALGLPEPKTKDELYKTLVAFRDKNPGNVKGVIPWATSASPFNFAQISNSFWTKMTEKEFATLSSWQKPGNKEGFKYINKLYNEKLISPDFGVDKTAKQFDADLSNGKGGFISSNFDYPLRATPGINANLQKNVPGASFTPIDPFENYEGKYSKSQYDLNGMFIMIPKSSKNAVQAIQYLNWMSDPAVTFFLQNGEEGSGYKMVDGIPQAIAQTGDRQMYSGSNVDYCIILNGAELGDSAKNMKAIAKSYPGYEAEATKAINFANTDTFRAFWFDSPNPSTAKYGTTLTDRTADMTVRLITCKPDEFDKLYDSLVAEYMTAGGQAIKDDAIKIYDAMKK